MKVDPYRAVRQLERMIPGAFRGGDLIRAGDTPPQPPLEVGSFQAVRLLIRQVDAIVPDLCREGFPDLAAVLAVRSAEALAEIVRAEGGA